MYTDVSEKQLRQWIEQITKRMEYAPEGTLKIKRRGGRIYYYQRLPGSKGILQYLHVDQMGLIQALAQKDYDTKMLRYMKRRLAALEHFDRHFPRESIESYYDDLCSERKRLVTPIILSEAQFIEQWMHQPYKGMKFRPDDTSSYYTDDGVRMRSKSEIIIAGTLKQCGIPYKYECPLDLRDILIYPDFTILDVKRRREIYLEHFGMMDMPDYANTFVRKMKTYQDHKIYPGERLFMTYETKDQALDTVRLKQLIEHALR